MKWKQDIGTLAYIQISYMMYMRAYMIKHIYMAPAIVMATQGVYVSTLYILRFIFYFIIFDLIYI